MDFSLSPEQQQIRDEVRKLCLQFDDAYWLEKDRSGEFPHELHAALAAAGWLGIAMPEAYGGAGLGITEAAIMMQAVAESGAAMTGASAVHINIFGLQPVVVFGTDEQKRRMLPPLIAGKDKACFAVTEPDAGLDTTAIKVRAERPESGNRTPTGTMLDGARSSQPDGHEGSRPLRSQHGLRGRGQCRQISGSGGRLPCLRDRRPHPRRHGLFQGIPRRTLSARGHDPADCADYATHDPQFHCREGFGAAQVLLGRPGDRGTLMDFLRLVGSA